MSIKQLITRLQAIGMDDLEVKIGNGNKADASIITVCLATDSNGDTLYAVIDKEYGV